MHNLSSPREFAIPAGAIAWVAYPATIRHSSFGESHNSPQTGQHTPLHYMLFRQQVLQARQRRWIGDIVLILPKSSLFLTVLALMSMAFAVGFVLFGSYTRRTAVTGELTPTLGLIAVYPANSGIIVTRRVAEGMQVLAGQTLYVISLDRKSFAFGSTEARIGAQVRLQISGLRHEIERQRELEISKAHELASQSRGLQLELATLGTAISRKRQEIMLARATAGRYQSLRTRGYVSADDLASRLSMVMQLESDRYGLERDQIQASLSLSQNRYQLSQVPLDYGNRIAELEQRLLAAEEELVRDAGSTKIVVTAPASGTATEVTGTVGQEVTSDKPLLAIVPAASHLRADFYVPTRAIGFVASGESVVLRYPAYPSEVFGTYRGTVTHVSVAAMPGAQLPGGDLAAASAEAAREPMYRVSVALDSQIVRSHGASFALKPGMIVTAQLLQETRPLYQWILSPLYGLSHELTPNGGGDVREPKRPVTKTVLRLPQ